MKMQKLGSFVFLLSAVLTPMAYGQTPTPTARDVISEIIEQAAKETSKNEKPTVETTKLEPWQTSPDEFAKELQRVFRNGDKKEADRRFNGKEVHWKGKVLEVDQGNGDTSMVVIQVYDGALVAPDGATAYWGNLVLDIPHFVMPPDKSIRFRVTLRDVSLLPSINEKDHSKYYDIAVETMAESGVIE